jgi:hypothetical protein
MVPNIEVLGLAETYNACKWGMTQTTERFMRGEHHARENMVQKFTNAKRGASSSRNVSSPSHGPKSPLHGVAHVNVIEVPLFRRAASSPHNVHDYKIWKLATDNLQRQRLALHRCRSLSDCVVMPAKSPSAAFHMPFVTEEDDSESPMPAYSQPRPVSDNGILLRHRKHSWSYQPSKGSGNLNADKDGFPSVGQWNLSFSTSRSPKNIVSTGRLLWDPRDTPGEFRSGPNAAYTKNTHHQSPSSSSTQQQLLLRQKSRLMLVRQKSVFEMDFPFVEGYSFGVPLFVLYAILVVLIMIKMASAPDRLANRWIFLVRYRCYVMWAWTIVIDRQW